MKILTENEFKQLKDKKGYIREYLEYYIIKTIAKVSSMKKDEVLFKAENIIDDIFDLTMYKIKKEKIGFTIIIKDMINYVENNTSEAVFNYYNLFKSGLAIKKEQPQALNAWESIQEILPYMKETTTYHSKDKVLISTIAKIGINYIQQLQEQVDIYTNRINPYLINELKERFIRYYNEFLDGKKLIELENNGGNEKQLKINYQLNDKKVLQSAKTTAKLNQFNNNVRVATKNIINETRG